MWTFHAIKCATYYNTKGFCSTFSTSNRWAWKSNDEAKTECKEGMHMETMTTSALLIINLHKQQNLPVPTTITPKADHRLI